MLSAATLALLAPHNGRSDDPLHLGSVAGLGIALAFLLHGANLAPDKLLAGMRNCRLHVFVQACTFLLFPLIGAALATLLDDRIAPALLTRAFFLCVRPSTISSSVAFTAMAGAMWQRRCSMRPSPTSSASSPRRSW